jgi:hypothetical protein
MEGAEDPLVQVAKVIVSPANRAHFNGGIEVTELKAEMKILCIQNSIRKYPGSDKKNCRWSN